MYVCCEPLSLTWFCNIFNIIVIMHLLFTHYRIPHLSIKQHAYEHLYEHIHEHLGEPK